MRYFIFLLFLSTALPGSLAADEKKELNYSRTNTAQRRPAARRPPASLPKELVLAAEKRDDKRVVINRRGGNNPWAEVQAAAERAARQVAADLASGFGYREYYKVGFHQAMRRVLSVAPEHTLDYQQGRQRAFVDRAIGREGEQMGRLAADEQARDLAERRVADQFHDLARQPYREPEVGRFQTPAFEQTNAYYREPRLAQVFEANPLHGFRAWRGREVFFYEGWRPDPHALYSAANYQACYDDRWRNTAFAFDCFLRDRKESAYYRGLPRQAQAQFQAFFQQVYGGYLYGFYERYVQVGHRDGYNDGYSYAVHISYDWFYRLGFYEAAQEALSRAAREGFNSNYARAFHHYYNDAFDHWQNNPVPRLEALTLQDGNDDGVFQPGEAVALRYVTVNYGGREGVFPLRLQGEVLAEGGQRQVRLAARTRRETTRLLPAQLSDQAPLGQAGLTVRLGEERRELPLTIAWPLTFDTPARVLSRDNLSGRAEVAVRITNISRKAVTGATLTLPNNTLQLQPIQPGKSIEHRFQLEGRDSLDMLDGQVGYAARLQVGGRLWDQLQGRLREEVTRLDNGDLLYVLLNMAHQEHPNGRRVRRAQAMMLRRIEADWTAVAVATGNAYKQDRRGGSRQTELAKLIYSYLDSRRHMAHPEVIGGMKPELVALGERLPGTHPFLRKQFRKLVKKMN